MTQLLWSVEPLLEISNIKFQEKEHTPSNGVFIYHYIIKTLV
jgi:hypothetical protein